MRFLVDLNLPPRLANELCAVGHDAVHGAFRSLHSAPDATVLAVAHQEGRGLVSADSDFGTILAATHATAVPYLRGIPARRVEQLADHISAALPSIDGALVSGSPVVLEPNRLRIRALPIF